MRFREVKENKEIDYTGIALTFKMANLDSIGNISGWYGAFINSHPSEAFRFIASMPEGELTNMFADAMALAPKIKDVSDKMGVNLDMLAKEFKDELNNAHFILEILDIHPRTKGIYSKAREEFGFDLTWADIWTDWR